MKDQKPIDVSVISPGKALVTVRKSAHPQVGRHREEQLTGLYRKNWGKIQVLALTFGMFVGLHESLGFSEAKRITRSRVLLFANLQNTAVIRAAYTPRTRQVEEWVSKPLRNLVRWTGWRLSDC